jgi:hypothetical protein
VAEVRGLAGPHPPGPLREPAGLLFRVLLPGGSTVAHGVLEAASAGGLRLLAARACPVGPAVLLPLAPHPLAGRLFPFKVESCAALPGGCAVISGAFDPPIRDDEAGAGRGRRERPACPFGLYFGAPLIRGEAVSLPETMPMLDVLRQLLALAERAAKELAARNVMLAGENARLRAELARLRATGALGVSGSR